LAGRALLPARLQVARAGASGRDTKAPPILPVLKAHSRTPNPSAKPTIRVIAISSIAISARRSIETRNPPRANNTAQGRALGKPPRSSASELFFCIGGLRLGNDSARQLVPRGVTEPTNCARCFRRCYQQFTARANAPTARISLRADNYRRKAPLARLAQNEEMDGT
jgi:hypothetical protein